MNFPSSVSNMAILCGTNNLFSNTPASIAATLSEVLSVLLKKCPTAVIHLFPILPCLDSLKSKVISTNSVIYF